MNCRAMNRKVFSLLGGRRGEREIPSEDAACMRKAWRLSLLAQFGGDLVFEGRLCGRI